MNSLTCTHGLQRSYQSLITFLQLSCRVFPLWIIPSLRLTLQDDAKQPCPLISVSFSVLQWWIFLTVNIRWNFHLRCKRQECFLDLLKLRKGTEQLCCNLGIQINSALSKLILWEQSFLCGLTNAYQWEHFVCWKLLFVPGTWQKCHLRPAGSCIPVYWCRTLSCLAFWTSVRKVSGSQDLFYS